MRYVSIIPADKIDRSAKRYKSNIVHGNTNKFDVTSSEKVEQTRAFSHVLGALIRDMVRRALNSRINFTQEAKDTTTCRARYKI